MASGRTSDTWSRRPSARRARWARDDRGAVAPVIAAARVAPVSLRAEDARGGVDVTADHEDAVAFVRDRRIAPVRAWQFLRRHRGA